MYVRMTDEVTAPPDHPQLRPTESSPLREHGLPLGPVLILLVVLAVSAALIM
ncbi:hypothetical protein ACFUTR_05340 [Streptomyces sp. NPDC057367]|uniref:hypothetical protein n=1 Tax=Streptomyces sp. NPDC057367 TaxID=3346108 RepID=UPI0036370C38